MRLASDLTQEELANRAKLTKGFISQLENEQTSISLDSLADILDALGISIPAFFTEEKRSQVVFSPKENIQISDTGAVSFELMIPGSTNNLMDPIMVGLEPGEELEKADPHPGEQFGYVLKGIATLTIDNDEYKVPSKHCFYFKSDKQHQISNKSAARVDLLWVTTPPQM